MEFNIFFSLENIRKLFPVAIKQSYKTELENIQEIIAVIEYYKSDIESALGKLNQDVDSPLFVSILRTVLADFHQHHLVDTRCIIHLRSYVKN